MREGEVLSCKALMWQLSLSSDITLSPCLNTAWHNGEPDTGVEGRRAHRASVILRPQPPSLSLTVTGKCFHPPTYCMFVKLPDDKSGTGVSNLFWQVYHLLRWILGSPTLKTHGNCVRMVPITHHTKCINNVQFLRCAEVKLLLWVGQRQLLRDYRAAWLSHWFLASLKAAVLFLSYFKMTTRYV